MNSPDELQQQLSAQTGNPWSAEFVDRMEQLLGKEACRRLAIFALPTDFVLSVVVPVYNEASTVASVVELLRETQLPMQIILIDDGSTDGTDDALKRLRMPKTSQSSVTKRIRAKGQRSAVDSSMQRETLSSSKTRTRNIRRQTFGSCCNH